MTRITNFGRKRTYIEAGFSSEEKSLCEPIALVSRLEDSITPCTGDVSLPPKKKRERTKKGDKNPGTGVVETKESDGVGEGAVGESPSVSYASKSKKKGNNEGKRQKALIASERRRKKRVHEKSAVTVCFACREMGHTAKDCPTTKSRDEGDNKRVIVGICYRCGSTRHTLSRCKKPSNPENPLPFASCFVCSGKGHLASSCPQNKTKGVYPNGGCCKLCSDSSHLAKDCGLRIRSTIDSSVVLGTGREAGADEDDFHIFKRRTIEMDQEGKKEEQMRRFLHTKAGAQPNPMKTVGYTKKSSIKKVVHF